MNDNYKKIIKENRNFFKLLKIAIKRHFFKWPFWFSLILTFFSQLCFFNKRISFKFITFLKNESMNFFSLSVSSIAIILAALAIVLVTYNSKQIKAFLIASISPKASRKTKDTFKGFVSPYILGALSWELVAFFSFLYKILFMFNPAILIVRFISTVYVFLIIYSIIFMMYLILEIIEHIILSSYFS